MLISLKVDSSAIPPCMLYVDGANSFFSFCCLVAMTCWLKSMGFERTTFFVNF